MHCRTLLKRGVRTVMAVCALALLILPHSVSAAVSPDDYNFTVTTAQAWTDTGLDLQTGDIVQISASSSGCASQGSAATAPDANLPLASAPVGSLIARLHAQGAAPLLIGTGTAGISKEIHIEEPSHLYLGVNGTSCAAGFAAKVHITHSKNNTDSAVAGAANAAPLAPGQQSAAAQPASSTAQQDVKSKLASAAQIWLAGQFGTGAQSQNGSPTTSSSTPGNDAVPGSNPAAAGTVPTLSVSSAPLDASLRRDLDRLPRRVNDQFNNLGDMVNFVLIGSQQQVQSMLDAANWHQADTDDRKAVLNAVLQTMDKKDYLAMPMSTLYLFGRRQDFGYEMAEPYAMVASRHHFRLWKAPFTWNGQTVWVGAGTHDIGFEKDQRNGNVTHKIDPAVDGERENIGSSLQKSGKIKSMSYYLPPNPVQDARNATGGGYHSDGRLLVVFLQ